MNTRVYIGRLPDTARDRDVERFFKGYGRIREILLKNGYGFVEFEDGRDADDAVYDLNGKMLSGERIIVEHARNPGSRSAAQFDRRDRRNQPNDRVLPPLRTPYRVIVENISSRTSWQELKEFLNRVGEVTFADAHKEHINEGVAEFATLGDMKNAITKLNNSELNGRRIHMYEDTASSRRRSRSRSRDRRRSGSRQRYRSRSHSGARNGRSRSPARRHSRSKSRSGSRSPVRRSAGGRHSGSRGRSGSAGGGRKRDRSHSAEGGHSGSAKREKRSSRSPQHRRPSGGEGDHNRSRSPAPRDHGRSQRSPSPGDHHRSRSHSRSAPRGGSPAAGDQRSPTPQRSPSPGANSHQQ